MALDVWACTEYGLTGGRKKHCVTDFAFAAIQAILGASDRPGVWLWPLNRFFGWQVFIMDWIDNYGDSKQITLSDAQFSELYNVTVHGRSASYPCKAPGFNGSSCPSPTRLPHKNVSH